MENWYNNQIILKVYLDPNCRRVVDIPITPETTCQDVIDCCKEPGEEQCHLAELWRECERPINLTERPYEILQQWGLHRDEVQFFLRHEPVPATRADVLGRRNRRRNGVRENGEPASLPSGVDLTLTELQEMAARQQNQIDSQQQILVAKEQRLKFLKQQEMKHEQMVSENERLRKLREKVEAQELKLKKLRALRGQVDQHKQSNSNLTSELQSIKALFNEKEKELSMAVSKVEELTKQLDQFRQNNAKKYENNNKSASAMEIEKLRRELLIRNKINEQQSTKLSEKKDKLSKKKEELSSMDRRIEELTARLQKKRVQQTHQNKVQQPGKTNRPMAPNIAAVEPYIKHPPPQDTRDDLYKDTQGFKPNKNDPKYQTLPSNLKFPLGNNDLKGPRDIFVYNQQNHQDFVNDKGTKLGVNYEKNDNKIMQDGGKPSQPPPYKHAQKQGLNNFVPRPYGSAYSYAGNKDSRGQPEGLTSSAQNSPSQVEDTKLFTSTPVLNDTTTSGSQPPKYSATPTGAPPGGRQHTNTSANENSPSIIMASGSSKPVYYNNAQDSRPAAPFFQSNSHNDVPSPVTNGQQYPQSTSYGLSRNNNALPATTSQSVGYNSRQSHVEHNPPSTTAPPTGQFHWSAPHTAPSTVPNTTASAGHQKHTYRYAPKSVIANTYMKKLGQNTLDQYRQNMMQLYKDFYPKGKEEGETPPSNVATTEQPGSPTAKVRPMNFGQKQDDQIEQIRQDKQSEFDYNKPGKGQGQPPPYPSMPSYQDNGQKQRVTVPDIQTAKPDNQKSHQSVVKVPESSTSFSGKNNDPVDKYNYPPYAPTPGQEAPSDKHQGQEKDMQNRTQIVFTKRTNLKKENSTRSLMKNKKVSFDPLALLLDASLEGDLDLVITAAKQVRDVSQPNDEGITAVHNAICAGHLDIVKFLVEFGCDVNSADSDGWTPLHCAASCNNLPMVKFLVEHGACIFATTISDQETAAEKCEEDEDGYDGCSEYLYSVQEKLGILNNGAVFALYDFKAENTDELSFRLGNEIMVLRKGDETEKEWWWCKSKDREGYIPRNLIGLHPRVSKT